MPWPGGGGAGRLPFFTGREGNPHPQDPCASFPGGGLHNLQFILTAFLVPDLGCERPLTMTMPYDGAVPLTLCAAFPLFSQ